MFNAVVWLVCLCFDVVVLFVYFVFCCCCFWCCYFYVVVMIYVFVSCVCCVWRVVFVCLCLFALLFNVVVLFCVCFVLLLFCRLVLLHSLDSEVGEGHCCSFKVKPIQYLWNVGLLSLNVRMFAFIACGFPLKSLWFPL